MPAHPFRTILIPLAGLLILQAACLGGPAVTQALATTPPAADPQDPTQPPLPTTIPSATPLANPSPTAPRFPPASGEENWFLAFDDSEALFIMLPTLWDDYSSSEWQQEGKVIGTTLSASSDLDDYLNWGAPGLTIAVSKRLDRGYIEMMDEFRDTFAEPCRDEPHRWEVENETYRGVRQRFWDCGGEGGPALDLMALVRKDDPGAFTTMVMIVWFYAIEVQNTEDTLLKFVVIPENLP